MKHTRPVLVLVLALALLGACSHNKRVDALRVTFASVEAAHKAFIAWDLEHQDKLAKAPGTEAEVTAKVTAYRLDVQAKVVESFALALTAIANGLLLNDDASLENALVAGQAIVADVQRLRGK